MSAPAAQASLARDTEVVRLAAGDDGSLRFSATVSPLWSAPHGPNGGYVAAIIVRALAAVVDDAQRAPRSLALHYLRPPAPGPCEIVVGVEREGRSLTSLSARLEQDGDTMVLALAAFSVPFASVADYAEPAPAAPPATELFTVPEDAGLPPIAQRCAVAPLFGPAPFSAGDEALAGGWLRLAEPEVADAAVIAFYTDAWLPAPFSRLRRPAPAPTVDLTIHFRATLPHPGLEADTPVLARFVSRTSAGGFFEEDGELWAPDGTLLAHSRQLAILMPGR